MASEKEIEGVVATEEVVAAKQPREYPIDHVVPEDLPLLFSDQMIVQHSNGVFTVSFFQNQQPFILKPEDAEKVESIVSRCVARLVFTPEIMLKNIQVLSTNWERNMPKEEPETKAE